MAIAEVGSGSQRAGVQRSGSSSSALTVTYTAQTSAGSLLVLVTAYFASANTSTVTDDASGGSNTWSLAVRSVSSSLHTEIWYAKNAKACQNVTITPGASAFLSVAVDEYSGADTAAPLDQTNSASGASGTSPDSGGVTTATAGELYIGAMDEDASSPTGITPEVSWTNVYCHQATSTEEGIGFESLGEASSQAAGTYNATFSYPAGAAAWTAAIATFKAAASSVVVEEDEGLRCGFSTWW